MRQIEHQAAGAAHVGADRHILKRWHVHLRLGPVGPGLGRLQPHLHLANGAEVLVELLPVAASQLSLQLAGLAQHAVQNALAAAETFLLCGHIVPTPIDEQLLEQSRRA